MVLQLLPFGICCFRSVYCGFSCFFVFSPLVCFNLLSTPVDSEVHVADWYVTFAMKSRVLATANLVRTPPTVQLALLHSHFNPPLPLPQLKIPQDQHRLFPFEEHRSHFLSSLGILFKFCCAPTISKLKLIELSSVLKQS